MSFSSPQEREAALVALAIEQPTAARAVFLQAVCGDDQGLRQRLEALLAAHEQPETPSTSQADSAEPTIKLDFSDAPDEGVGTTLGRYKLLELIGEGGCGVVYVAEQTEPVRRRVALKVIKLKLQGNGNKQTCENENSDDLKNSETNSLHETARFNLRALQ
jgi:hypothetical protein